MPLLVGRRAPDFMAPAVLTSGVLVDRIHLHTAIHGKYALLFFNPLALTLACSSELPALDRYAEQFRQRNVELLGITLDAPHQHSIWRNIPADYLKPLGYPLIIDVGQLICRQYGLAIPGGTFASRGAFLIDHGGLVRYQAINELPLNREIDQVLNMIDALRAHDSKACEATAKRQGRKIPGTHAGGEWTGLSAKVGELDHV
jgi:peroxiredoxin 2/4